MDETEYSLMPIDPPGLVHALEDMCRSFESPETVGEHEFVAKYGASLLSARGNMILKQKGAVSAYLDPQTKADGVSKTALQTKTLQVFGGNGTVFISSALPILRRALCIPTCPKFLLGWRHSAI